MDEEVRLHLLSDLQLPDLAVTISIREPSSNLPLPVCTAARQRQLKIGAQPADAKIATSHSQ
jgi:hypothetical protein